MRHTHTESDRVTDGEREGEREREGEMERVLMQGYLMREVYLGNGEINGE